ncbi:MAG: T9SS type A sorting domain-containing protein [Ignavibacteriae bacterium]|nr:T9SS type A sorting domain-containing protein [Ignavibacteriota bacterium]
MKISIALFVLFFMVFSKLYSQNIQQGEFMVVNNTGTSGGHNITVKIYPSGAVFSGYYEYTLKSYNPIDPFNNQYIFGKDVVLSNDQGANDYFKVANFDRTENINGCSFSLGYGKYKVEILVNNNVVNWCYVDFSDANYCVNIPNENYYHRLVIDCDPNDVLYFKYLDNSGNPTTRISAGEQVVKVWEQLGTGHGSQTPNKGDFTDYANDISPYPYHDFPIDAHSISGNVGHETPEEVYLNLKVTNFNANLSTDKTLKFYNSVFTIASGKKYTVNGGLTNSILISGQGAKFVSGYLSSFNISQSFTLYIQDQASIEANGTEFNSSDPNDFYSGISLSQPGASFIRNCIFNDIGNPINSLGNGSNTLMIDNNTFNDPKQCAIYMTKTINVLISNNHFWLPFVPGMWGGGINIVNNVATEEDNNSASFSNSIDIIGNDFHNGSSQLSVTGLTDLLSIYIKNNYFSDGINNIWFNKTVGSFSNNSIYYPNPGTYGIVLTNSNINFLNNTIQSDYNNLEPLIKSFLYLSPVQTNNQLNWSGGQNHLESFNGKNIYASTHQIPGYFYTDLGRNNFIVDNNSKNHLEGYLHTCEYFYNSHGNCWYVQGNPHIPKYELYNDCWPEPWGMPMLYEGIPSDCVAWDDQLVDIIITDMGNGIFDTVLVTQSNTIPPPSNDAALYGTGIKNQKLKNYSSAIINFKNLINTYPNSKHLGSAVFNLYECYVRSDTNRTQSFRNVIFGNLKNYLEDKIQQYENNDEFVSVAFDFVLKCKVKIKSYPMALDGYEFIAGNSSSETERLMASLSYIDVEGLIQGGNGGGAKENKNAFKAIGNINKQENKTPIKDILLKVYSKAKETKKQKENLDLQKSNDISKTRADIDRKHSFEKSIENRALNNISISGSLNAEQRRERIRKDLLLLAQKETDNKTIKEINSLPINYSLSQNYPNPFNPATKINFAIPKQGFVTLKIYDIIGREIKTLVNEVKQAGYYTVDFNGSSLASGVYFYRIQSGDFVTVKRMVLVK